jgi:hypothetical protein
MHFKKGFTSPLWTSEIFMNLPWSREPFNDPAQQLKWMAAGYRPIESTGSWIDISNEMFPTAISSQFGQWKGLNDIGLTIYKMETDEILPVHFDTYKYYRNLFKLDDSVDIVRTIVFLKDWSSGHYIEIDGTAQVGWKAGDWFMWANNTPHMAANIGLDPRYTLQITGWIEKGQWGSL